MCKAKDLQLANIKAMITVFIHSIFPMLYDSPNAPLA